MIRKCSSLSAISNLLLLASIFLPGFTFAQIDVRFINQAFNPQENMNGIRHAILTVPELAGVFTDINVLELVETPDAIVPTAVRIQFQRAVAGEPDFVTLNNAMAEIIEAQAGPGAVFDDFEINAAMETVTFTINFADMYRFIVTTPRDRDNTFDPPSDGENEEDRDPPSPPSDGECTGNFPNDFSINYHHFDFSFNSAF